MVTAYTPGPWRVEPSTSGRDGEYLVTGEHACPTASICYCHQTHANVNLANAKLIAAAPALVAMLERVLDRCGCRGPAADAAVALLDEVKS